MPQRILTQKQVSALSNLGLGRSPGISQHPAAYDHRHSMLNVDQVIFSKRALNMNVATDQALDKNGLFTSFLLTRIRFANASISLTTAVGGIYTRAAKAGIAVVAAAQAYAALTGATTGLDLTIATVGLDELTVLDGTALFLSLTTPQGAGATADCWVLGIPLTEP